MSESHKHAAVLMAIAGGEKFSSFQAHHETWDRQAWACLSCFMGWIEFPDSWEIRRKQKTHVVNGFAVPEPLQWVLKIGESYFIEDLARSDFFCEVTWRNDPSDVFFAKRGIAHPTAEGAIANCKARLGIDPYKEES